MRASCGRSLWRGRWANIRRSLGGGLAGLDGDGQPDPWKVLGLLLGWGRFCCGIGYRAKSRSRGRLIAARSFARWARGMASRGWRRPRPRGAPLRPAAPDCGAVLPEARRGRRARCDNRPGGRSLSGERGRRFCGGRPGRRDAQARAGSGAARGVALRRPPGARPDRVVPGTGARGAAAVFGR
jgi:hypothetical protein